LHFLLLMVEAARISPATGMQVLAGYYSMVERTGHDFRDNLAPARILSIGKVKSSS